MCPTTTTRSAPSLRGSTAMWPGLIQLSAHLASRKLSFVRTSTPASPLREANTTRCMEKLSPIGGELPRDLSGSVWQFPPIPQPMSFCQQQHGGRSRKAAERWRRGEKESHWSSPSVQGPMISRWTDPFGSSFDAVAHGGNGKRGNRLDAGLRRGWDSNPRMEVLQTSRGFLSCWFVLPLHPRT